MPKAAPHFKVKTQFLENFCFIFLLISFSKFKQISTKKIYTSLFDLRTLEIKIKTKGFGLIKNNSRVCSFLCLLI